MTKRIEHPVQGEVEPKPAEEASVGKAPRRSKTPATRKASRPAVARAGGWQMQDGKPWTLPKRNRK